MCVRISGQLLRKLARIKGIESVILRFVYDPRVVLILWNVEEIHWLIMPFALVPSKSKAVTIMSFST